MKDFIQMAQNKLFGVRLEIPYLLKCTLMDLSNRRETKLRMQIRLDLQI